MQSFSADAGALCDGPLSAEVKALDNFAEGAFERVPEAFADTFAQVGLTLSSPAAAKKHRMSVKQKATKFSQ